MPRRCIGTPRTRQELVEEFSRKLINQKNPSVDLASTHDVWRYQAEHCQYDPYSDPQQFWVDKVVQIFL